MSTMTSEEQGAAANTTEVEQSESETKEHAAIIRSPLLDGTFFRVVSMKDGNHLKAVCTTCTHMTARRHYLEQWDRLQISGP